MNKVITINLGGLAYQLEEGGYDVLRAYLETAAARLRGNPDGDEILADIERAIGEKFRALLGNHKTVVVAKEVEAVLAEMGPVEAEPDVPHADAPGGASGAGAAGKEGPAEPGGPPRRLYRIQEGAMIAGVCNGIATYVNIDPTLVRLGFVLLTIFWGTGLLVYVVMAIILPEARSPEEKAAASGFPATAQEYIRRAKAGYYEAMKNFPDRKAHREWTRQFKRDMRAHAEQWRYNWQGYWAGQAPGSNSGIRLALPLLTLLEGMVTVIWTCTLVSLLATGNLFGLALPPNVPVWVAAVGVFMAFAVLAGSLKTMRRLCHWGLGPPRGAWALVHLLDAMVWLVVVAVLLWLAVHYFPELRQAIHSFPGLAHQAVDDIRTWWNGKT
jgi:phage shock protein PspC (stress-responsive transcriptional regulator)